MSNGCRGVKSISIISQYMQSYWFSKQSKINIIYNISVITITITMSIILANFGKYAISDCPFIVFGRGLVPVASDPVRSRSCACHGITVAVIPAELYHDLTIICHARATRVNIDFGKQYIDFQKHFRFGLTMQFTPCLERLQTLRGFISLVFILWQISFP